MLYAYKSEAIVLLHSVKLYLYRIAIIKYRPPFVRTSILGSAHRIKIIAVCKCFADSYNAIYNNVYFAQERWALI